MKALRALAFILTLGVIGCATHKSQPAFNSDYSVHDEGFENAWIVDSNEDGSLVEVLTIDSKIDIIFQPISRSRFHKGWIAPVTFQCFKDKKPMKFEREKCNANSTRLVYISNELVEVKQLTQPKK